MQKLPVHAGMVAGQVLDIEGEKMDLTLEQLEAIHLNKTGALLSFCIEAGALLADVDEEKMITFERISHKILV